MMVIDISLQAAGWFILKTVSWIGLNLVLFVMLYYPGDNPNWKPGELRHYFFGTVLVISALLIYGVVRFNFVP